VKKAILTIFAFGALASAECLAKNITITLRGTKVDGTSESVTYGPGGSVTLKATCTESIADCASVTVSVPDSRTIPNIGDPTVTTFYDSHGTPTRSFQGGYISVGESGTSPNEYTIRMSEASEIH
jgi:hypothetical protein